MVLSTNQTKTATLVLSLALLILAFFNAPQQCVLQPGCGITGHLCYHFFHANFFHALCNVWCLLALAFYYDIEDWELLLAWLIAASVPSWALSPLPSPLSPVKVIGFSGICFALMGIVFYKVARKSYYLSWIIPMVAVGFLIPGMAAVTHLYCFTLGITLSLVYSRIRLLVIRKRKWRR
jgi:membrane associated rhomboid family serine protease